MTKVVLPELKMQRRTAAAEVENGMVLGLGSGAMAGFALEALAVRVAEGLRIVGAQNIKRNVDEK